MQVQFSSCFSKQGISLIVTVSPSFVNICWQSKMLRHIKQLDKVNATWQVIRGASKKKKKNKTGKSKKLSPKLQRKDGQNSKKFYFNFSNEDSFSDFS